MDKIATATKDHVLVERIVDVPQSDGARKGKTACGRTVWGHTGATIAPMIDCEDCRKTLRRKGYQV